MDLFDINQKIAIYFPKENNMVEIMCTIEKMYDDRLDLKLPKYFMRYIEYLQEGAEITAKVFSKRGTVDFNSIVISSPLEEAFTIELDYNAIKINMGDDAPSISAIETMEIKWRNSLLKVKTLELSTEYVKFYSDQKFKLDEVFEGAVILPENYGIINFRATIAETDPNYVNEYKATYITMSEDDRQGLLYYIYNYNKDTD